MKRPLTTQHSSSRSGVRQVPPWILDALDRPAQPSVAYTSEPCELATLFEARITAERPRLLRLARARGLSASSAEDVVQETLVVAWRHLEELRTPETFDAWLAGICRNLCRRHMRAESIRAQRQSRWPGDLGSESGSVPDEGIQIPDAFALDPLAELERHDLEHLLDRALGFLPPHTRGAVELFYVAGLSQREAAQRLGLTIRALEGRLARARKQLGIVLQGELRAEAEAFDLPLGEHMPAGWRETRVWCPRCARQRLHGAFEPLPTEDINLHLRCPSCAHEVNSWGHIVLRGMRSFRPAYNQAMRYASAYFLPGLASGWQACYACGTPQRLRLAPTDELGDHTRGKPGLMVVLECVHCARHRAEIRVVDVLWSHPAVQRFMDQHPRYVTEPETLVSYQNQPAIRVRLVDYASAARLTLLAHHQTLRVLDAFQE